MNEHRETTSWAEIASGLATVSVGLGVLTMALFPFSLVGLLLFVVAPVVLVIAPLLLLPLLALLVAAPFILLFRGARKLLASRSGRGNRGRDGSTSRAIGREIGARPCS
jgi:hypothetical protein